MLQLDVLRDNVNRSNSSVKDLLNEAVDFIFNRFTLSGIINIVEMTKENDKVPIVNGDYIISCGIVANEHSFSSTWSLDDPSLLHYLKIEIEQLILNEIYLNAAESSIGNLFKIMSRYKYSKEDVWVILSKKGMDVSPIGKSNYSLYKNELQYLGDFNNIRFYVNNLADNNKTALVGVRNSVNYCPYIPVIESSSVNNKATFKSHHGIYIPDNSFLYLFS